MSRKASQSKAAARKEAGRDKSIWAAAKGHARDDKSKATFQRAIDRAQRNIDKNK